MYILCIACVVSTVWPQNPETAAGPYRSGWTIDGLTIAGGIAVAFSAAAIDEELPLPAASEIALLNKNSVNVFDRIAAGNYSKMEMTLSDAALVLSFASPLALLTDSRIRNDWGTIAAMYVEMGLYSNFLPSYGKGSTKRYRPYLYSSSAPLSEKQNAEAMRSFFSGHATRAFAAGVMTAVIYEEYYPASKYRTHVWIASIGMATACAALRVTSGAHFPTDVIVGAAVGGTVGYIIPLLHRTGSENVSLRPYWKPDEKGIGVAVHF